jgi:ribosomal protein S18 acetylase RimI-like enzyme
MPIEHSEIALSPLDTSRFGVRTARADALSAEGLSRALDFCRSENVQLLIGRCMVEDTATVHALEAAGFLVMDTLVYYQRNLAWLPVPDPGEARIRLLRAGEEDRVEAMARECFRDYGGHYHADPRLDRRTSAEVYASWARAACEDPGPSGFVLVGDEGTRLVAFSAFRLNASDEGELTLGAVSPTARGLGIYRLLTQSGMFRMQTSGVARFVTSTYLGNWGAQASWTAAGLSPFAAYHTFHRWFDAR